MRIWQPLGAAILLLTLTACSSTPVAEPTPDRSPSAAAQPTSTATVEPEGEAAPQECIDYDAGAMADTGPLSVAAAAADLPAGVVLNPGLQVIESVDDPGMLEIVARVCSSGLDRDSLVDAGNEIAAAIYAAPEHASVTLLMVSSYVPTGDFLDKQPDLDVVQTDYELYLWDAEPASLASNWQ